jgi:triosephosphate isomerase
VTASLRNGLVPVVAIAEDTTRYNPDDEDMAPLTEIAVGLAGVDKAKAENIVIAYEPAWAIGASEAPSLEVIEHAGRVIRNSLAILFTQEVADKIRIQYGGSVTPENSKEILGLEDIDGLLIGRASLEPAAFLSMVKDAI